MEWRKSYNDLCNEIEILLIRQNELNAQIRRAGQRMKRMFEPAARLVANYGGMPGKGFAMIPFEPLCGNVITLNAELEEINDILSLKLEARQRIEDRLDNFEDLSQRVMVMRDIQRKQLGEIAEELGYSESYIRKVSMKTTKRKYRVNAKKGTIREHIS